MESKQQATLSVEHRMLVTRLLEAREAGIILFTLLLIVFVSLRQPAFLSVDNFSFILLDIAITVIVALGQMMVIIARGIDLSVGSIIGLVGMSVGMMIRDTTDFPMSVAVLVGTAIGLGLGIINGLIITKGKVPPIIATLGTLSIYRGFVIVISKGQWVDAYRIPRSFLQITRQPILGIPAIIVYAAIIAVVVALFLHFTRLGRQIYALGSNPEAAKMIGIPDIKITFIVFAISGLLSGFAGVLWASRFGSVVNDMGTGFELLVIAACVVGGVNIMGGSGTVLGVVLGSLLLGVIVNALTITGISPFWRLTVQGLIILLAVIADSMVHRRVE